MTMETPKRKYKKLSPATWAEVRAVWEIGEATLEELAEQHGVTTRTLQAHFEKNKTIKGSKAREIAAAVQEAVFADNFFDQETRVQKYRETRLADYNNAAKIESLIMAQLEAAQTDPSAGGAKAAIKRLSLAAQALQRTSAMKQKAIGVVHDPEELPVIRFENLTEEDIEEIRKNEGGDYDEEAESNDAPASAGSHDGTARPEVAKDEFEDDDDIIVYEL